MVASQCALGCSCLDLWPHEKFEHMAWRLKIAFCEYYLFCTRQWPKEERWGKREDWNGQGKQNVEAFESGKASFLQCGKRVGRQLNWHLPFQGCGNWDVENNESATGKKTGGKNLWVQSSMPHCHSLRITVASSISEKRDFDDLP